MRHIKIDKHNGRRIMLSDNNLAGGKPVGDGGTKIRELHPSGKVAR